MTSVFWARDMIHYYCTQREIGEPLVSFATQTGANLKKLNAMKKKHPDQSKLNNIIYELNKCVTYVNKRAKVPTVWLSKFTHHYHSTTRRYHSGYQKLEDGLHPGDDLAKSWAGEINRICRLTYNLGKKEEKQSLKITIDRD